MAGDKIPTLSLFTGAGGLDLGFVGAGFEIIACVEIEKAYVKTLSENAKSNHHLSPSTEILCQDVRDFDPLPYVGKGIRCIIGGPPCQTFSAAGRRSGGVVGLGDERGQLFRTYCEILKAIQPDVFVFENVYGLPGANGGEPWREIIRSFALIGYELRAEVVDAADYGVPQHRERLIMVGFKRGDFCFPLPSHGPDAGNCEPLVSVERAICDLQSANEGFGKGIGGLYGHLLPDVPEGLNYAFFTSEMGHPEPVFAWRSKFHDLLYKVKRNEPCRTIKAQPGKFTGPFHWKNRHFSISELKRLQSFPDDYEIVGSYGKVVEQIGNSVPPRLAYAIAASVRDQLLEPTSDLEFDLRPKDFSSTFRQRQRERSKQFKLIAKNVIKERHADHVTQVKSDIVRIDSFQTNPTSMFDKRENISSDNFNNDFPVYKICVIEDGNHIELQISRDGIFSNINTSYVKITGLEIYIPKFSTLSAIAMIENLSEYFHLWNLIENALVSRSKFFSLIDIYGHYANKGDAVNIEGRWGFNSLSPEIKILNFFGNTERCGSIIQDAVIFEATGLDVESFKEAVKNLRKFRLDIRTSLTHPILGANRVLCTYPFPLLSPRALVESKVQLLPDTDGESESMLLTA